jgi:putative methyltransferase (TIGR04325 family)
MQLPNGVKRVIKEIVPPAVLRLVRPFRKPESSPYGYSGDYATFEAAMAACKTAGYAEVGIVERVGEQTRAIKERWQGGPAAVLLDGRVLQNLAATLLATSTVSGRAPSVLDFGGGLGIHHAQLSPFLSGGSGPSWLVCETTPMADEGNKRFASGGLRFVSSLEQAPGPFDLVIASGVLQCLPDPYATLAKLASLSEHILLNRVPLIPSERDRLTIHNVDPVVFTGVMPIWFLAERRLMAKLAELGFDISMRWEVPQDPVTLDGTPFVLQGMLARRRRR